MSDRQDNGRPPMPEGMGETESQDRQIVRYEEAPIRVVSPYRGFVWCVFGALLGTIAPPLAAYFAAFGAAMLSRGEGDARVSLPLVVLCALGLLTGSSAPDIVVAASAYLVGCLFGAIVARRGTSISTEVLLTIVLGIALIATDAWRAANVGTTIEAVLEAEVDSVVEVYASQMGLASASALDTAREVSMLLWPSSYLLIATVSALCAHMGARGGLRRMGTDSPRLPIVLFDAPLWTVGILATSILLIACSGLMGEQAGRIAMMLGANALLVARVMLALDGFGVVAWILARLGIGRIGFVIALVIAVNVEFSLPIMSGIGLIDFWANFRHLVRGKAPVGESQS